MPFKFIFISIIVVAHLDIDMAFWPSVHISIRWISDSIYLADCIKTQLGVKNCCVVKEFASQQHGFGFNPSVWHTGYPMIIPSWPKFRFSRQKVKNKNKMCVSGGIGCECLCPFVLTLHDCCKRMLFIVHILWKHVRPWGEILSWLETNRGWLQESVQP